MKRSLLNSSARIALVGIAAIAMPALADSAKPAIQTDELAEITVTAAAGNRSNLDSSVSVSSVSSDVIADFHPASEGDMLRLLPGLQPNISGSGGNGNFAVRGLPVATGGATFVQLQEDGLPQVLYGDAQFGNNDYWTKSSPTDERIEAIRGGTAATLASQAPGAVVNYVSQTGRGNGGYVDLSRGINNDMTRISFLDRGSITDSLYYNIGGYHDEGNGLRDGGYEVSNSYLVKGNITQELADDRGYVRLLFKFADTHEPNDPGGLVCGSVSGNTNVWGGAHVSSLNACPGFDIRNQSTYSKYYQNISFVGFNGGLEQHKLDGISTDQKTVQGQFHYDFKNGLLLDENGRYSDLSGGFASNFFSIAPTSGLIGSTVNGQTVAQAVYSAGPNAGHPVTEAFYNNNVAVWTDIRDMSSYANDLKLSWQKTLDNGLKASVYGGWFFMSQNIGMDWHPSQFNAEASPTPSPIDLLSSSGNLLSAAGYYGYNNNWGSCCARTYDYTFTDNAPYVDLILDYNKFELDASAREDINRGTGTGTASTGTAYTLNQTAVNPVTGKTQTVAQPYYLPDGVPEVMDYGKNLVSWSFGGSYKVTDDLNVFVRSSRGNRFNADRMSFSGYFNKDGSLNTAGQAAVSDQVNQNEIGVKNRGDIGSSHYTVELTAYKSDFNITTYELNPNICGGQGTCVVSDKYRTTGFEFYGTWKYGPVSVIANATYNQAEKEPVGAASFKRSNGIPDLSYSLATNYNILDNLSLGMDVAGVTSTLDSNGLEYPGSAVVTGNLRYLPIDSLEIDLNVYNLFNSIALMGPGNANNIYTGSSFVGTASAAPGRTATASIRYRF